MKAILDEIRVACEQKLFYLAVMLCLALPDICAALEHPTGQTSEKRYRSWVDTWLGKEYGNFLPAQDMYRLRCGVMHQGRMGHPGLRYKRLAFSVTMGFLADRNFFPNRRKPELLNLNAQMFCYNVCASVQRWEQAHKGDPVVQANLARLVQYHPDGLSPYVGGIECLTSG